MRKKNTIFTLAITAAVILAVSACGSKNSTADTTAATTKETIKEVESTTATVPASTEATTEEATEESVEETTASEAGSVATDGKFIPVSGRYEITPPADWALDESSDPSFATFFSPKDDIIELVYLNGDDAVGAQEQYPATAEEYKKQVSRDDNMTIVSYDVKTKENGSQTFRYAMKYTAPSDGIYYITVSGSYDASKKDYVCATATVMNDSSDTIAQVEEAVNSFKVK